MNLTKPKKSIALKSIEVSDGWLKPWRFAVVLAALIFVCFPAVVAGFETFYFRDFGTFGYPLASYQKDCFWRGELPLWNPLNSCGVPFLAQWNTLTLYPPALFYLLFPLSWSLGMFNLAHLFWAGLGMYFLAHRWTGNRLAASVAGMAFAFNGLTWHSLMWPNNIAAFGWMPWVVLLVEKAWKKSESAGCEIHPPSSVLHPRFPIRPMALAALAGAMQMLSGAPEIILLTWVFVAMVWLAELVRGDVPRGRLVAVFACICVLVAGLAAAQLLPFLDLLSHSQRDTGFTDANWVMPLGGWANYLVPLFHTFQGMGVFSQYGQYWTGSYYLGTAILALALMALLPFGRGRDRRAWMLTGVAFFGLVMAMGDHLGVYPTLKKMFPFMGFMRYPIKFVVLPTFAIPLLAALGVARLQNLSKEEWVIARRKLFQTGLVLLVAIAVISLWEWVYPIVQDDRGATVANAFVRAVFLVLFLVCFELLRRVPESKLQHLLQIGLMMLLWFDVFTHTPNLSPTVERTVFEPDIIRQYFKWDAQQLRPGESRAMATPKAVNRFQSHSVNESGADVSGRRLSLFADYNLLDHAAKVDGFYSLDVREMGQLSARMFVVTNDLPKLEDFLGVAEISNPTNVVDWVPRSTYQPFITAGQEPLFLSADESLRAVMSDAFAPTQAVYLEPAARSFITAHRASVKIISHEFSAQQVSAQVQADAPAMLVVAQAFYHCWHAYVDGKPTQLWRANHAFQALEVPAGSHTVKLVYEDSAFKWGAVISLASLLIVMGSLKFKL